MKLKSFCLASLLLVSAWCANAIDTPKGKVALTLSGNISQHNQGNSFLLDDAILNQLPQKSIQTSSPWYNGIHTFSGPSLKDVLALAGSKGKQLKLKAINDYTIVIPSSDADLGPIIARTIDGKAFSVRDKGPLFLIYPFDSNKELQNRTYYSRSIWQLVSIKAE
ncbi:hypothetical protein [Deefgea piscis]|uniref:hypothetical protein n=1 Tax=Deefgea piscis TaxID=2739061 RepID=UPI001C813715|nr:hypothetical protein [Deefgea piscis]QZA81592.1 hypothetical protein K4H25_02710 [Deefgea piscis]